VSLKSALSFSMWYYMFNQKLLLLINNGSTVAPWLLVVEKLILGNTNIKHTPATGINQGLTCNLLLLFCSSN